MTETIRPIAFTWDGDAMAPLARFRQLCDKQFVIGEIYTLVPHEERSAASHGHYFAAINECWKNLPDRLAMEFPTSEKLRKWALVEAGYYSERRLSLSSAAEARKVAAFMQSADDFAVISVAGSVVVERTAKSQSLKAMGKAEFQASKQATLDVLAGLIGVDPATLSANAAEAA